MTKKERTARENPPLGPFARGTLLRRPSRGLHARLAARRTLARARVRHGGPAGGPARRASSSFGVAAGSGAAAARARSAGRSHRRLRRRRHVRLLLRRAVGARRRLHARAARPVQGRGGLLTRIDDGLGTCTTPRSAAARASRACPRGGRTSTSTAAWVQKWGPPPACNSSGTGAECVAESTGLPVCCTVRLPGEEAERPGLPQQAAVRPATGAAGAASGGTSRAHRRRRRPRGYRAPLAQPPFRIKNEAMTM